jgi:predicted ATPase
VADQPSGTVTLVFTDIEGSTRLLHELGQAAYGDALAAHRRIVREACSRHDGYEVDYEGDFFFYAFASVERAVRAVQEAMQGLESGPIRLRVGIHTGTPGLDPPKYVGLDVHLAARVMSVGYGGQVLLSRATRELLSGEVLDLGEHRLKDFPDPVWLYQLGKDAFPPLRSLNNTNLPTPASSFLGREVELERAGGLLERSRLITISGPGGAGKTRFAIELASGQLARFPNGVFWVPLAALREATLVVEAIAQTLGAQDGLAEHIGQRRMLLLIDNLEQVIGAAPELSVLASACPNLSLVVTSRELLRVEGEVDFPLPPLASQDGVQLFCARAGCDPEPVIEDLCRRLDGLPLAIELAAARMNVFTPQQLSQRLGQRLDLLKGRRDAEPRQQTLRATIKWSYDLLNEDEAALLRRLSIFVGGWTLEMAESAAAAEPDLLESLVEKNLVRHTAARFSMLETIGEFAMEQLELRGEAAQQRRVFADYFLDLAERLAPDLDRDAVAALDHLEAEHDNLRAVLEWSTETNSADKAARVSSALGRFWSTRGHLSEGRLWLEESLALYDEEDELKATLLRRLGWICGLQGNYARHESLSREFLRVCQKTGDRIGEGWAYINLGVALAAQTPARLDEAKSVFLESELIAHENGNRELLAYSDAEIGVVESRLGETEEAKRRLGRARALYAELGLELKVAWVSDSLASVMLEQQDNAAAIRLLRESCEITYRFGNTSDLAYSLFQLAAALTGLGERVRPARLLGAAGRIQEEIGFTLEPAEDARKQSTKDRLLAEMGQSSFEGEVLTGERMAAEDVLAYALTDQPLTAAQLD